MSVFFALLFALAPPASVQAAKRTDLHGRVGDKKPGQDELRFLGWNDACSVALEYYSYPPLGESMSGDPDKWRVGTVTVEPDADEEEHDWNYSNEKTSYWDRNQAKSVLDSLAKEGYDIPGFFERVREARVAPRPGLYETLHTTAAFKTGDRVEWPDARFKIESVRYSPFGHCTFILYRDKNTPRASYDFRLVRILEPGVRRTRARAHATNGLLLYKDDSDIYAAEAEFAIAVAMDPKYALALYYHGLFLITHGRYEEGLERFGRAAAIDEKFIDKAKQAVEFESVRNHPEYKKIIGKRPAWIRPAGN
jgi:tetratricopeptide (TPR) repeat protein